MNTSQKHCHQFNSKLKNFNQVIVKSVMTDKLTTIRPSFNIFKTIECEIETLSSFLLNNFLHKCIAIEGLSPNEAFQTSIAIILIHFFMIDPNRFKQNVSV